MAIEQVDKLAGYPADKRYFSIREVAALLGVVPERVYQFIREERLGYVPATEVLQGAATPTQYLIERNELARFIAIERVNGVKLT